MLRNREHLCTVTNLFPLLLHGNGVDNIDGEIMYQDYIGAHQTVIVR